MRDMSSDAPYARGNEASRQAAEGVQHQLTGIRARVMDFIVARGEFGAISDDIASGLNILPYTAKPRCTELKDSGYIQDSGRMRKNKNRRNETVWVACASPPTGPWLKKLRASAEGVPSGREVFEKVLKREPNMHLKFWPAELDLIRADLDVAVAISRKGRP